ncbi:MAG: hypothetical protein IIA44_02270, partial [Acidobacteria bacterium]|nr:hypothetical protein [Acidobacteriota bacterium]
DPRTRLLVVEKRSSVGPLLWFSYNDRTRIVLPLKKGLRINAVGRGLGGMEVMVLLGRIESNERIAIAGGSKRVGDALAEAGVPLRVRPRWAVVEADGTIAWLAGVRAAPSAVEPPLITVRARRTN